MWCTAEASGGIFTAGQDGVVIEFRERGAVIREGPTDRIYDVREVVVEDLNGLVLAFGESMTG